MESSVEALERQLQELGVSVSGGQQKQLHAYILMLERWNRAMNLTSLSGPTLTERLVAEPLWVARELRPAGRYLDVGSGNGSPALPWHALLSFRSTDLVESRRRRAIFLERTVRRMGLAAVTVHPVRLQDVVLKLGTVDWITVQGVRVTPDLVSQLTAVSIRTTRLVWLTKSREVSLEPTQRLQIPNSSRSALVFDIGSRTSFGSG